jgi:hypothetical protein
MLQTSFPKLKTHHPTNLYMLYPMMQSVLLVCVEKVKKMTPQARALSMVIITSSPSKKSKSFRRAGLLL